MKNPNRAAARRVSSILNSRGIENAQDGIESRSTKPAEVHIVLPTRACALTAVDTARLFRSHEFWQSLSFWNKFQCQPVVAIALPGGRWTIIKNMPLMTAAACTVVLCARQYQLKVFFNADAISGYRLPKAGPASAAIVLSCRRKQREIAASARIRARTLLFVKRARARRLGGIIAQHLKTIIRQ